MVFHMRSHLLPDIRKTSLYWQKKQMDTFPNSVQTSMMKVSAIWFTTFHQIHVSHFRKWAWHQFISGCRREWQVGKCHGICFHYRRWHATITCLTNGSSHYRCRVHSFAFPWGGWHSSCWCQWKWGAHALRLSMSPGCSQVLMGWPVRIPTMSRIHGSRSTHSGRSLRIRVWHLESRIPMNTHHGYPY